MNIWISYLLDCMEAYSPECRFNLTEGPVRKASTVAAYHGERLRGDTLYLCLTEIPGSGNSIPESAYFVTQSDSGAEHLKNRIVLTKAADPDTLLDLLLDAGERYRTWLDRLMELSFQKSNPQEYLDASTDMLKNPLLVQDPSFTLIAMSKDASSDDYPFFDFGGTLRPTPEFLLHARWDMNFVSRRSYDDEGRAVVAEQDGKLQIFYNILSEGVLCANVTCAVTRTEMTQGIVDLLHELCRFLRHSLNLSKLRLAPGSSAGFALEQLLQFQDPDPLVSMLAPKQDWKYVVGTLNLSVPGGRANTCMMQIQETLPHAAVCLYESRIRVVLCVSGKESEEVYYGYQYQRLEKLAETLGSGFGLSYALPNLMGVRFGMKQSERALELVRNNPAERKLALYSDVATDDILDSFFDENKMIYGLVPEIASLFKDDIEHNQNNCSILYFYLLMGKSLAGTSEAMHMHRSTIVYRLNRMKENYGLLLEDPEQNLLYLLCCRACLLRSADTEDLH